MTSNVYSSENRAAIEQRTQALLNAADGLVASNSTRAVGDAVQELLSERFREALGDLAAEYTPVFGRRDMADLAFKDAAGNHHAVDVKTHRGDTKFNMPNLVSVKRLADFYEKDTNVFSVLFVRYATSGRRVVVSHVAFTPIEWLSWSCLTLGALGNGQLQIANAEILEIVPGASRRTWMLELCSKLGVFYPKEVQKIAKRILYFEKVRDRWQARGEDTQ